MSRPAERRRLDRLRSFHVECPEQMLFRYTDLCLRVHAGSSVALAARWRGWPTNRWLLQGGESRARQVVPRGGHGRPVAADTPVRPRRAGARQCR